MQSNTTSELEVTVESINNDLVTLIVSNTDKKITLPGNLLTIKVSIGDKLSLGLSLNPEAHIQNIITTAKEVEDKNTLSMQRLLEELIN